MKEVTFQRARESARGAVLSESLSVYGIDHGPLLVQRRSAWDAARCALLKTGARLELARLLRFEFRFDGGMRVSTRPFRSAHARVAVGPALLYTEGSP